MKKKMPTYSFRDTRTEEEFDKFMSRAERKQYLEVNKFIQPVPTAAGFISGHNLNAKLDGGFKDTMSKIAEAHPTSAHAHKYGSKSIKDTKTRNAIEKWRQKRESKGDVTSVRESLSSVPHTNIR